jgi:hypothetical protein
LRDLLQIGLGQVSLRARKKGRMRVRRIEHRCWSMVGLVNQGRD